MILLNYSTEKYYNITLEETDITLYQQSLTNIQTVRTLNSVQTDYFLMFSNHNHFNCVNYRKDQFLLPRMNTDHNL